MAAHYFMVPMLQRYNGSDDNSRHGEQSLTTMVKIASLNVFNILSTQHAQHNIKSKIKN